MGVSLRAAFFLVAALLVSTAANSQPPIDPPKAVRLDPTQESDAAAWVAANAHPFDAGAIDDEVYAGIIAALGPADIYGLGEVTHGTHEDQQFKADLIKALIRAGKVDRLALEANYTVGLAFDRYVRLGVGDPVALVRSTDFFRIWKGDEFAGLLTWIRAYNLQATRPVSIIAIDIQLPGRDLPIALADLARRDQRAAATFRRQLEAFLAVGREDPPRFSRVWLELSSSERIAATAAAKALLARFDTDAASWRDPDFSVAHEAARRAWQGMSSYGMIGEKAPSAEESSRRDRYMGENLLRGAADAHGVALWAHNEHVAANYDQVYEDMGQLTVGRIVQKSIGDRYRTIGATYSQARVLITQVRSSGADALSAKVDDRVHLLTNDGAETTGHLFDLAGALNHTTASWLLTPRPTDTGVPIAATHGDFFFGEAGWLYNADKFQRDPEDAAGSKLNTYDVLVWFRNMTPHHRWPNVPMAR